MEITFDTILSIATLLLGGGGIGAFFTWRYVRREAAAKAKEKELRTDRDHYRDGYIEMRNRLDKTDENVRGLQREVARYGRVVDGLRPFLCYDTKCKKRQRVPQSQCEGVDAAATTPLKCTEIMKETPLECTEIMKETPLECKEDEKEAKDIEPIDIKDM